MESAFGIPAPLTSNGTTSPSPSPPPSESNAGRERHSPSATGRSPRGAQNGDDAPSREPHLRRSTPLETADKITEEPSRLASPRQSYGYHPGKNTPTRAYHPDASIVLIGIRGSGNSTLGVIASGALGFRLVDADHHFYRATKLSRGAYKSTYGVEAYRREEVKLMRSMLLEHTTKAVIVCGPGVVEATHQAWLAEYALSHPMIYVVRDADKIQQHLRAWDVDTISRLARITGPTYRTLSNFEFYNLSDPCPDTAGLAVNRAHQSPRSLALKEVEIDFLQLIYGITSRDERQLDYDRRRGHPFGLPETRPFTYSLSLPMSTPDITFHQLRAADVVADAVELVVSAPRSTTEELTLDNDTASHVTKQLYMARRNIRLPIIFHVSPDDFWSSGSSPRGVGPRHDELYLDILHHGLRLAPEYLSVDLRCDDDEIRNLIAAKGSTKIIGHYYDPNPPTNAWESQDRKDKVQRAEKLGCDLVRLCQVATSTMDNFAALKFSQDIRASDQYNIPIIAYNTGPLGRTSCFLNTTLSPVTHPLLPPPGSNASSASLLTVQQAQNALYSSFILHPVYFGIYGSHVAQSLSPVMYNAAFKFYGVPHRYDLFQHQSLDELRRMMHDPQFGGASISAPFKREVLSLVDEPTWEAKAIGAVNTLVPVRSSGLEPSLGPNLSGPPVAFRGDNTDWIGIYTCVRRNLSPINAIRSRTTALVLGAGGMARAATYALLRLGVRTIFVHNRTIEHAMELTRQFEGPFPQRMTSARSASKTTADNGGSDDMTPATMRVIPSKDDPWPSDADHPVIIVSCVTTKEVDGQCCVDTSLPPGWLDSPTGGVAVELGYTPPATPLMQQIHELDDRGWIGVDGLQVLPEQALVQFEHFTGRNAPGELMRREVRRAVKARIEKP